MKLKEKLSRLHYFQSAVIAFVTSAFIGFILPMQSYLRNTSLYDFTMPELLTESLMLLVSVGLCLFVLLSGFEFVFGRTLGRIPCALVLAFVVCEYLETGVLSQGLPLLNGDITAFQSLTFRKLIDTATWVVVFGAILIAYIWLKDYLHYIAFILAPMMLVSLAEVNVEQNEKGESLYVSGFCPKYDVLKSVKYGCERNVIVLVPDSVPGREVTEIASTNVSLRCMFQGFTAYENNMSMHNSTIRAMPGMLTGLYLNQNQTATEYAEMVYGDNSCLDPYVKSDISVYFSPGMFNHGYTNRRVGEFTKYIKPTRARFAFQRNTLDVPYPSLAEILLFRMTPTLRKYHVLREILAHVKTDGSNPADDAQAYSILAEASVSQNERQAFVLAHTKGAHFMITQDGDGNVLPRARFDREGVLEYLPYQLKLIGRYLQRLKEIGIYDNSLVVITADHGSEAFDRQDIDGHANSMLWIKPIGATNEFSVSDLPTSHLGLSQVIKSSVAKDLTRKEIEDMIVFEKRRFLAKRSSLYFDEYVVDKKGEVIEKKKSGPYYGN